MDEAAKLSILIDIQAKLGDLLKSQEEFRKTKAEAQSFGSMLKTGLGIDLARRGLELLKASVVGNITEAFRLAGQLKDVSQNLQIATEPLQVLTQLVKSNGGEMETLTQAIVTYRGVMAEARDGNAQAAATFRNLGLDLAALSRLPVERQLEQVARAIVKSDNAGAAFDNTVKLLGTRNAPKLTQSLRELAEQGYDKVAASAKDAGQVMADDTINRLDRAQKMIEEFKRRGVIATGNVLSYVAELFGIKVPADNPTDNSGAARAAEQEKERRDRVAEAQNYIAQLQKAQQLVANDPALVESKSRERQISLLQEEIKARETLLAIVQKSPDPKVDPLAAEAAIYAMAQEIREVENRLLALRGVVTSSVPGAAGSLGARRRATAFERIQDEASGVNSRASNPNYLTPTEGVQAGVMQWVTQLGSTGQQVAGALQSSLGSTVGDITTQLTSAITQTQSWGAALNNIWRNFGLSMLQAFVQMVAQWAVSKAAMFAIDMVFAAKSLALSLASAAKSLVAWIPAAIAAAISSYGIAAIIGAAAVVGAIAAFREQGGPVEAGRPYIVGEKRPEVFVPNQSGTIVPSVDAYRAIARGPAMAGGGAAEGAMAGKPRLLVVYTDHSATVEGLKRRPEFETLVVDINRRNLGEIGSA